MQMSTLAIEDKSRAEWWHDHERELELSSPLSETQSGH